MCVLFWVLFFWAYLCLIEPDYIWSKEAISYIQQSVWQQPSLSTFLVTVGDIRQVSIFQASSNNIIMFSYLHLVLTFKANVTYDSTPFLVASFNNVWLFMHNKHSHIQLEVSWSRMDSVEMHLLRILLILLAPTG